MPSDKDIIKQSKAAYGQFAELWRAHAKENGPKANKSLNDFKNIGIGKPLLLVANGASFENDIETIKENKDCVDIAVCDKSLGHAIDAGLTPKYCIMCDANVDAAKYLLPWKDKLKDTILFSNICGNPKWSEGSIWKDEYFFVNQDVLKSEVEFSGISGCRNFIPAATNVSNAMLVFFTQSGPKGRQNFFGYDKTLLIGFDYCWQPDGHYYAFDKSGQGKHNYMRHIWLTDEKNKLIFSSNNLKFSASWLEKYISTFKPPVVNCSYPTLLRGCKNGKLKDHITYSYMENDSNEVLSLEKEKDKLELKTKEIMKKIGKIKDSHWFNYLATT